MNPAVMGALVGGGLTAAGAGIGGVLAAWIAARNERETEQVRIAIQAAIAEREALMKAAERSGMAATILPLSVGAFYHVEIQRLLRQNELSPAALGALNEKVLALAREINRITSENAKRKRAGETGVSTR